MTSDPASQILTETQSNDSYSWDGHVNLSRSYATNGLNQYESSGAAAFCYDANGNLTADGSSVYLYDVENRLVEKRAQGVGNANCVALSYTGAMQAQLLYDPTGRLHEVSGGTSGIQRFAYDGNTMIAEYSGSNAMLRRYVHGSNADADDPLIWYEGATQTATLRRYLHSDPRGSIVAVTDHTGNRMVVNSYDEYGIPDTATGNDIASKGRFRYTGQAWIPEIGMYYYKARIYSPTLGRFLQTDPIGYEDHYNLYAYVGNDPINGVDPTGLAQACATSTGSRIESCVTVNADIDNDGEDDLSSSQLRTIGSHFSQYIKDNRGADLSSSGLPTVTSAQSFATENQVAFTSVVGQFVGHALSSEAVSSGYQSNITRIYVGGDYRGSSRAPASLIANNQQRTSFTIALSTNSSYSRNFSNASALARLIIHETLHTQYPFFATNFLPFVHERIDARARRILQYHGLDGGGCPALVGFPAC